jgi:hypothetical protein
MSVNATTEPTYRAEEGRGKKMSVLKSAATFLYTYIRWRCVFVIYLLFKSSIYLYDLYGRSNTHVHYWSPPPDPKSAAESISNDHHFGSTILSLYNSWNSLLTSQGLAFYTWEKINSNGSAVVGDPESQGFGNFLQDPDPGNLRLWIRLRNLIGTF